MNLPKFRDNTWDMDIFRNVVLFNEYKLPENLKNFKVIDIGGHIGSFSWLCAAHSAKEIFYCEALKENFDIGINWIEEVFWKQKIKSPVFATFNVVIWKEDENNTLTFLKSANTINTGGGSVMTNENNEEFKIATFPFDDLIKLRLNKDKHKDKILLKIDCEGSEYPILFSSKRLGEIDYICGEYHELTSIPEIAKVDGYDTYDAYSLQRFLKTNGFLYTFFDRSKDENDNEVNLGHFWASRTKEMFFEEIELSDKYQEKI